MIVICDIFHMRNAELSAVYHFVLFVYLFVLFVLFTRYLFVSFALFTCSLAHACVLERRGGYLGGSAVANRSQEDEDLG
jgi:hypothetical protein